jgi:uncharacterized membrane protein
MTDLELIPESKPPELLVEMSRLHGLSDAVFAFALTLLVLDIRIPEGVLEGELITNLIELGPKVLVYLISFVVIGVAWISHQRMLGQIKSGDGVLVWFNLFSLLFVTLLPACSVLLGRFPNSFTAIACFAADVVLIQLAALWLWRHSSRQHLINPALDPRVVSSIGRRIIMSALVFGLSTPLALWNPIVVYLIWISVFILLVTTDWLSWQLAIKTQPFAIPLEDAKQAQIHIEYGLGQLNIGSTSPMPDLLQGIFGGGLKSQVSRSGEVLQSRLEMSQSRGFMSLRFPWAWETAKILDWTINLNQQIPYRLDIESGGGQTILDLYELQVAELAVTTSMSSFIIGLPANAGLTNVSINAVSTSLQIKIPPDVAAHIRTTKRIASVEISLERFPQTEIKGEYISADFETATNRVEIQIELLFGSINII